MEILRPILSLVLLLGVLWLASSNRKAISWPLVIKGLVIQFGLAFLILELDWISSGFDSIGKGFRFFTWVCSGGQFILIW